MLHVKGLVICFYLGWSGSILQFGQNIIKVGSKSWLLTCSSNITLSLPSYNGSALKRELNFCNDYHSLLYFWLLLCFWARIKLWSIFYSAWITHVINFGGKFEKKEVKETILTLFLTRILQSWLFEYTICLTYFQSCRY